MFKTYYRSTLNIEPPKKKQKNNNGAQGKVILFLSTQNKTSRLYQERDFRTFKFNGPMKNKSNKKLSEPEVPPFCCLRRHTKCMMEARLISSFQSNKTYT